MNDMFLPTEKDFRAILGKIEMNPVQKGCEACVCECQCACSCSCNACVCDACFECACVCICGDAIPLSPDIQLAVRLVT